MHALKQEINILVDKLSALQPGPGSVEARVMTAVSRIAEEAQHVSDPQQLSSHFSELNHLWANAVPWCSELSKELEKMIIMHAELLDAAGH